jgi:hypothetical protein
MTNRQITINIIKLVGGATATMTAGGLGLYCAFHAVYVAYTAQAYAEGAFYLLVANALMNLYCNLCDRLGLE